MEWTILEYRKFRNALYQELDTAKSCFDLYLRLYENQQNKEVFIKAPTYFRLTMESLARMSLGIISNLFEVRSSKQQPYSFKKFLSIISHHKGDFFKDDELPVINKYIGEMNELLDQHQNIITILKTRRDKYYSHFDKTYFFEPEELFKSEEGRLINRQVTKLIELGDKILKRSPGGLISVPIHKGYKEELEWILSAITKTDMKLLSNNTQIENPKKFEWDFKKIDEWKSKQNNDT